MKEFHPFSYLISQYWWIITAVAMLPLVKNRPSLHPSGSFNSFPIETPWNDSEDPIIFAHMTDLHINSVDRENNPKTIKALNRLLELGIKDVIITGDLVDNWESQKIERYGHQVQNDYKLYKEITEEKFKKFDNVIDMPGNHDVFGLYSFDSPQHYVRNYSHFRLQTQSEYQAFVFETENFVFLGLNPYRFPSPHARFDFWARQTTEQLNHIEAQLREANKRRAKAGRNKPLFVGCHYPIDYWIMKDVKTDSGYTFEDLIVSSNVTLFLSGHTHPDQAVYLHHKGMLEAIGMDVKVHSGYSIITVDNGRTNHKSFTTDEDSTVLLTHPVPQQLISNAVSFAETNTAIRLVAKSGSLNIKVRGDVTGQMTKVRSLNNGWYLYSLPLQISTEGKHKIEFYGDWNSTVEFFVGNTLESFNETDERTLIRIGTARLYSMIISITLFFFVSPITIIPFSIRDRLSPSVKKLLFTAFLAPFFVPISLINIEGHWGFNFWYGFCINRTFFYDIWGQIICFLVYNGCIVGGACCFASCLTIEKHPILIVDVLAVIASLSYVLYFLKIGVTEASGLFLTLTSPLFILVPIWLYCGIIFLSKH